MVFGNFKRMLLRFDNNGWKGRYNEGPWSIANGGYDLWFEIYYNNTLVAQCIDGEVSSHFNINGIDNKKLVNKILEIFPHLKREKYSEIQNYYELNENEKLVVDNLLGYEDDEHKVLTIIKNKEFVFLNTNIFITTEMFLDIRACAYNDKFFKLTEISDDEFTIEIA